MMAISYKEMVMYRRVAFMQDNSALYPYLTGYDHLTYVVYAQNTKESKVETVAKRVGNYDYLHKKIVE